MDCNEAQRLLGRGLTPGPESAERAALGFHLAGCPACRSYRASLLEQLLAELLLQRSAPPPLGAPALAPPERYPRAARALWLGGLAVLGSIMLVVLITLGSLLFSLFNIHRNVQAMIVSSAPPSAAPTLPPAPSPTPAPPSATPPPTASPTPSATPTPTASPTPTPAPPTATPAPPPAGGPITVLLLGSDRRPHEAGPARTDSIVVARIDPQRGRAALLSLPRDLWVEVPGYSSARINTASLLGETHGGPAGGLALARATVAQLLGVPVDHAVYIDFEGFIGAIDALGGISVPVERELYDPRFPTMDYGYTEVHFLPGPQQMDGATALTYSRIRHPDSDFARMRRQQAVLVAIAARLREQNLLQSVRSIEQITGALRPYVRTDLPEQRLIGLLWALRDLPPEQIERYRLDPDMVTFGVGGDRWAEVARPGVIRRLAQQLIGEGVP